MKYKPYEYQTNATNFIVEHPTAAVFLEMGLGKSVITLTALHELMLNRFEFDTALIIAPKRVARDTWPSEIEKWDHLKGLTYSLVMGTPDERLRALKKKAHIYIINRELVPWLIDNIDKARPFGAIVIDELSSFKSYQAQRFRSLLKIRPTVKRIIGLTGTPSSNGLMDLWAEFRLLDMGKRLGRFITHYRNTYFTPDKRNGMVVFSYKPLPGAEDAIYRQISDITISMKAIDYLKMPERIMNNVRVSLSKEEKAKYNALRQDLILSIGENEIDAANAASLSNKLSQMANGAVYGQDKAVIPIHEHKLDALEDLIEGANGKPLLVAYWFKHDLDRISKRFKVREIKTSKDIKDWNEGKIPLAVIHPASAGHGLNIQFGGSTLVWFGLTWSLELYQQTNARLWRQGQKETVVIHHIITEGTIDEQILKALAKKEKTQDSLIDAVKAELGRFI